MYTYIHTVNNSNATQLQPSSGWQGPSFPRGPGRVQWHKISFSTPNPWFLWSSKVWECNCDTEPVQWGGIWWITQVQVFWEMACLENLLEQGHSLSWSHPCGSREICGIGLNLPPESLSLFFQTWESSEMRGFKEKCSIPDTQVIFHTSFSFLPASKDSPVSSKGSSAWAASESSPGTASDARCQMKAGWKPRILPECSTAELKAFLQLLPGHLLGPDQIQWVTEPEFGHSCVCVSCVCLNWLYFLPCRSVKTWDRETANLQTYPFFLLKKLSRSWRL